MQMLSKLWAAVLKEADSCVKWFSNEVFSNLNNVKPLEVNLLLYDYVLQIFLGAIVFWIKKKNGGHIYIPYVHCP